MKRCLSTILALLLVVYAGACLPAKAESAENSVSVFVATDRHARYETEQVTESVTEQTEDAAAAESATDKKKTAAPLIPVFDEEGQLIFHDNLADLLRLVLNDVNAVQPSVALLGGDNIGQGGDNATDVTGYPAGAPYFSFSEIDEEIASVLGADVKTLYTYGSHDRNMTDLYHQAAFSGPFDGDGYHIYGITYAQMIYDTDTLAANYKGRDKGDPYGISAQEASYHFLEWVLSLEDHQPIIVMSHVPLHAHRGDNTGALTWLRALNLAATTHDVLFLYGHNHTLERDEERAAIEQRVYLVPAGNRLTVQNWVPDEEGKAVVRDDDENLLTENIDIRFTYMNAGYITLGYGSLLTFADSDDNGGWDTLTVTRYSLDNESPIMFGTTGIESPWVWNLQNAQ